jgi:beta-fructofuranosidase
VGGVLRLADDWVWDSWTADDGERFHLFFLKAPRTLGDLTRRHTHASVGHATSTDLAHWAIQPDVLAPAAGGWDDLAIWTGSVVRGDDGLWRLFYSGLSKRRGYGSRDQRIGAAVSADLTTWTRVSERPIVAPDPTLYKTLDEDPAASATWRDPFVFKDPDGDGWHMLITARKQGAPRLRDGVLGHARSHDLATWELQPPLTEPAGFGELEVAQARVIDGQPLLLFTCHPDQQAPEQVERFGRLCTWSAPGAALTGPWDIAAARPFEAAPDLYAAPLVQRRDGSHALLGFLHREEDGIDSLAIVDPIPVALVDGTLRAG